MRRLLGSLLLAALLPLGCAAPLPDSPAPGSPTPAVPPAPGPSGDVVRVMTWNVLAREYDPPDWAPAIAAERPDVVALQEVCAADVTELAGILRAEHGLEYTAVPGPVVPTPEEDAQPINAALRRPCNDGAEITFGLGVLTTLPVDAEATELFVPDNRDEQRGYQRLDLRRPDGGPLRVLNTHIGLVGVQEAQLRVLAEIAVEDPAPTLVLGDLNVLPGDPRLGPLRASLAEVDPGGELPTSGPRKIDYIFHRGFGDAAAPRVPPTTASDHDPLVVDLATPEP